MIRVPLRDRARGRWHGILPSLGMDHRYLTGKNGPCPLCPGGRHRWRFLNTDGNGTWICTHCGSCAGIDLAMRFTRSQFKEVAHQIESIIGDIGVQRAPERNEAATRAALGRLWRDATPVREGDPTDLWLRSRRIDLDTYPSCLRTGHIAYCEDDGSKSQHPAMLALVTAPDGTPATIHRTYLTLDGRKAPVESTRKLYSAIPKGSAVRLGAPGSKLGVAEGIETALAAAKLFKVPTWAAICAGALQNFEPPADIKSLLTFGDNDANHVGQRAAYALAARLSAKIAIEVRIPERIDTDWNDVLTASLVGRGQEHDLRIAG